MLGGCLLPLATILVFDVAFTVDAHEAGTHWTYPPACCRASMIGGDCHSIPKGHVRQGHDGYVVYLRPGDHPQVTTTHVFLIPYGNEIPSGDGDFHACLHPSEYHVNCFFAPPSGM